MVMFIIFTVLYYPVTGYGHLICTDSTHVMIELCEGGDLHLSVVKNDILILQQTIHKNSIARDGQISIATPNGYRIVVQRNRSRSSLSRHPVICGVGLGPYFIHVDEIDIKDKVTANPSVTPCFKITHIKPDCIEVGYYLPEKGAVKFILRDITGRVVRTLINNVEAGYHVVNWDTGNLPSGIYFLTVHTGSLTKTEKLILLK